MLLKLLSSTPGYAFSFLGELNNFSRMRISFVTTLPILVVAVAVDVTVPVADAADCFIQRSSGNKCVRNEKLWVFRDLYCKRLYLLDDFEYIARDGRNLALITHTTVFGNQTECWDSIGQIIKTCYGKGDGGTWNWNDNTVSVNFCAGYLA